MITNAISSASGLAACEHIRLAFTRYRSELEWLAYFISGDRTMAEACVADACALSASRNHAFEEWLLTWARHATVRATYDMLRGRIGRISFTFEDLRCDHEGHRPLSCSDVQLVIDETTRLLQTLDVLARCALILCGIEKYGISEAASFLGINAAMVEAAYCHALDAVEVIRYERLGAPDLAGTTCN